MNQRQQGRGANYQYGVKRRDFNRAAHTVRLAWVAPSAQLRRAALIIAPTNPSPGAAVFALSPRGADRASCRQSSPLSAPSNGAWLPFSPRENNFLWDAPVSITRNSLSPPKTGSFAPGTDGSNPSPSSGESTANLTSGSGPIADAAVLGTEGGAALRGMIVRNLHQRILDKKQQAGA
jgi:hypothetical protein